MMRIKLTKLEAAILRHRLEVPDALADALEVYRLDTIEVVAEHLLDAVNEGEIILDEDDVISAEILADCVEGSTYFAAAKGDGASSQKLSAIIRAGESLEEKIEQLIDRKVCYPTW